MIELREFLVWMTNFKGSTENMDKLDAACVFQCISNLGQADEHDEWDKTATKKKILTVEDLKDDSKVQLKSVDRLLLEKFDLQINSKEWMKDSDNKGSISFKDFKAFLEVPAES